MEMNTVAVGTLVRVRVKAAVPEGSLTVKAIGSTTTFSTRTPALDLAADPLTIRKTTPNSNQAIASQIHPVCLLMFSPSPVAKIPNASVS
jgi:hypothetical protein